MLVFFSLFSTCPLFLSCLSSSFLFLYLLVIIGIFFQQWLFFHLQLLFYTLRFISLFFSAASDRYNPGAHRLVPSLQVPRRNQLYPVQRKFRTFDLFNPSRTEKRTYTRVKGHIFLLWLRLGCATVNSPRETCLPLTRLEIRSKRKKKRHYITHGRDQRS